MFRVPGKQQWRGGIAAEHVLIAGVYLCVRYLTYALRGMCALDFLCPQLNFNIRWFYCCCDKKISYRILEIIRVSVFCKISMLKVFKVYLLDLIITNMSFAKFYQKSAAMMATLPKMAMIFDRHKTRSPLNFRCR